MHMPQTPKAEELTFHLIFTPGSVQYTRLFTLSLLQWLPCSFRLVNNGCAPQEADLLERFSRNHSRLDYVDPPFRKRLPHAAALNHLQQREASPYFCFMDSDIMAARPFLEDLLPLLPAHCALFSGRPVWLQKGRNIMPAGGQGGKRLKGYFSGTTNGFVAGTSFFAIYDNRILSDFIAQAGIGFQRYAWPAIPKEHRSLLEKARLKFDRYDTGKVLNLLLQLHGRKLCYLEPPGLEHLGGLSSFTLTRLPRPLKTRFKNALKKTIRRLAGTAEEPVKDDNRAAEGGTLRITVSRYFYEHLKALFENRPPPSLPAIENPQISSEVERLAARITAYYHEKQARL